MISIGSYFLMNFVSFFSFWSISISNRNFWKLWIMTSIKSWPDPIFFFFFNLIAIWKLSTGPRPHNLLGSKLRLDSWFPDRQFSTLSIVPNPQSLFEIKFNFAPSGEKLKEDLLRKSWLFWELKALTDLSFQRIIHNLKYSFPKT